MTTTSFAHDGKTYDYPFGIGEDEALRREYRSLVIRDEMDQKTISELRNLPLSEKVRRYARNAGLEFLAGTIEGLTVPLMLGGTTIRADTIREKKEPTLSGYKRLCEQRDAPFSWINYKG